jgi:LuxR family maltose regulon positive regulatory protein
MEPPLDAAERALAGAVAAVDEPFEPSAGRAASMLVNIPAQIALHRGFLAQLRGDAEGTAAFAAQARAELRDGERLLGSIAQGLLAAAQWLRGLLADAEQAFVSSIAGWQAGQPISWGIYQLGQVQRAQGRLDAAAQTYRTTLDIAIVPGRAPAPPAGPAYVGLGEVAYQRNELDSGLVTLAWIRQAQGDPAGALEAINEAGRDALGPDVTGLINPVPAQRARLLLAQGDVAAAARWAAERGLGPDDEPGYPREPEYLVLARVLLAQDRPGPALTLLEAMLRPAAAQGRTGSVIEIGALRALALAGRGDQDAAVDAVARALALGCPQGYVRVFADEGAPMAALLARLAAAQKAERADPRATLRSVPPGCLAEVRRAFGGRDGRPGTGSGSTGSDSTGRGAAVTVPGLMEQLTARELEVLVLLATGMPNPRIAEQLFVTLDTVKKHVSHVLGKLGAANRTEAVTRARQLSLIP